MTSRKGRKPSFAYMRAKIKKKYKRKVVHKEPEKSWRTMTRGGKVTCCVPRAKKSRPSVDPLPLPLVEAGKAVVRMDRAATMKIVELVEGNPHRECGLLFIGNICTDSVTGATIAFVDDVYTDGIYGEAAEYTFSPGMQIGCMAYIERMYGGTKHVIGTIHSHGNFNAFFSSVDKTMMGSRISDEVHMVISPSYDEYVLTFKDRKYAYNEADLDMDGIADVFKYVRRRDRNGKNGI